MRAGILESYLPRRSPVHRLPARTKLLAALAMIVASVSVPADWTASRWFVCAGIALVLIAATAISRLPALFLARRLLFLEPFVFGVALLSLWQPHGWVMLWQTVARSTLCLATLLLLAATTPFSEIVRVLRGWRVPPLLLTTVTLMDRYLYVLVEESGRMQRARASRVFTPTSRFAQWRSVAETLGELFVRSVARATRIYAAMCARGWETSAPPKG